jgi:hypothetical protein
MISTTAQRVRLHTQARVNESIRRRTAASVAYHALHPDHIPDRLHELDEEWDIERMLETISAAFTLVGLAGVVTGRRRWLALPMIVQGFFLQHAVQGWCPPLPALRRLGFRTTAEIDEERYALKALRGDFVDVAGEDAVRKAELALLAAVQSNGWTRGGVRGGFDDGVI